MVTASSALGTSTGGGVVGIGPEGTGVGSATGSSDTGVSAPVASGGTAPGTGG